MLITSNFIFSSPASCAIHTLCIKPSVCLSVTLNGVTNCNRWTPRTEILHTGMHWSPVAGDQELGHPDLLY